MNYSFYKNIFFLTLMMSISSACDVISKILGSTIDIAEVNFFRFFFGLVSLLPFLRGDFSKLFTISSFSLNFWRGILGLLSFYLYTYSLIHLKLAEVVAISWTCPMFTVLLSHFFLKEQVSPLRYFTTLIGLFTMSAIVFVDNSTSFSIKLLYFAPIGASLLFAAQDVLIKKMLFSEDKFVMLFYYSLIICVFASLSAYPVWKTPTIVELLLLILLGVFTNLQQLCLFSAYCDVEISALATFKYLEFILSSTMGFLVFSEIPSKNIIIGVIVIVPMGLYLARCENKKKNSKSREKNLCDYQSCR